MTIACSVVVSYENLTDSRGGTAWMLAFTINHLRAMTGVDTWTGQLFIRQWGTRGLQFEMVSHPKLETDRQNS